MCKQCGALAIDGAQISFRALCADCGNANMMQFAKQVHEKSGPAFDNWRESMRRLIDAD